MTLKYRFLRKIQIGLEEYLYRIVLSKLHRCLDIETRSQIQHLCRYDTRPDTFLTHGAFTRPRVELPIFIALQTGKRGEGEVSDGLPIAMRKERWIPSCLDQWQMWIEVRKVMHYVRNTANKCRTFFVSCIIVLVQNFSVIFLVQRSKHIWMPYF